jgi:hypothetical protein
MEGTDTGGSTCHQILCQSGSEPVASVCAEGLDACKPHACWCPAVPMGSRAWFSAGWHASGSGEDLAASGEVPALCDSSLCPPPVPGFPDETTLNLVSGSRTRVPG